LQVSSRYLEVDLLLDARENNTWRCMVRVELLETVGFEFIDIQEFYSELLPNKHGRAIIGGTISGADKEEYLLSGGKLTQ